MSLDKTGRVGKTHKLKGGLFIENHEINGCRELATRPKESGMKEQ